MDFKTVVIMVKNLIENTSGLKVEVEIGDTSQATLKAYAKKVYLGSTSVSKAEGGDYIIGGKPSGCFISAGRADDLYSILKPELMKIEKELNKKGA